MMRRMLVFLILISTVLAAGPSCAEIVKSTSSADSFAYRTRGLRDPFIALNSVGAAAVAVRVSTPQEPEELEKEFNPSSLVIKALLGDGKSRMDFAVIASQDNPDQSFLVQKGRIKHVGSGIYLPSYTAKISGELIIVQRIKGDTASYTVQFPQSEKEDSP